MKKFLIIALVAVMAITGSVFAYTFTTATVTIGVTAIQSDFANVTANLSAWTAPKAFGRYTGDWNPPLTLFEVSPHGEYTGDLVVHVYLANTGDLIQRYHHVNMALEFRDNTDTIMDDQQEIQVLTLSNADVLFEWSSGNGTPPYYVKLTGGGYRLHPWKAGAGGGVQPQVWCEVTQR